MSRIRAKACLDKVLAEESPGRVLDFGCGAKTPHRPHFEAGGWEWCGLDLDGWHGAEGWLASAKNEPDLIWASHVLEHIPNPVEQLREWRWLLLHGGVIAVTVPLRKDAIVGGHINLYNAGLLIYHAVLAGFDCSEASVRTYGREVSLIVRKPSRLVLTPRLNHDAGDIEKLAHLFPPSCRKQGFDGMIEELNW